MEIIADLEVHSKYARAVSSSMTPAIIGEWSDKKGIHLVGTGDFTHPIWLRELEFSLEEEQQGTFKLINSDVKARFLLTSEVSCMYKHNGKGRRVHLLVYMPSFSSVKKFNSGLTKSGANLFSDGRPIIGLSLKQVARIALEADEKALLIPAHVWTPWFGFYGSMSGYESLSEAFEELEKYIPAVETGLSSDPAMNWKISELSGKRIVSFGDAHSPQKLGREATVFQIKKSKRITNLTSQIVKNQPAGRAGHNDPIKNSSKFNWAGKSKIIITYQDIHDAIWGGENSDWEIGYTIEFYPEEGKYHYTGHRNCKVVYSPNEARKMGLGCPVCGKTLTMGVMSRVEQLALQEISSDKLQITNDQFGVAWIRDEKENKPAYVMLVPLLEILSESFGVGVGSRQVVNSYEQMISIFGSEFAILLKTPVDEIKKKFGERVAESIQKVRSGDIFIKPGYDGVFGEVKIWKEGEDFRQESSQTSLF